MTILITDTETTGIKEPEVIELAWLEIDYPNLTILKEYDQYFKPNKPISYGAMATHHILPEDLENKVSHNFATLPSDTKYIIGHNIDFDWRALKEPNVKRICTLAMARKLLPKLDSHTQSALLYFFLTDKEEARQLLKNAHNALCDIHICYIILINLLTLITDDVSTIEKLYGYSEKARIPEIMPFGKHRGELIKDIPSGYKEWLLKQDEVDPYLIKALRGK